MSLKERGQRGEEKGGVGRLEVKGRRGGRRGEVRREGEVKGRRGGGEEDGGEREEEERWREGRVGVKESLEARRICLSDSCYWPFFSPLPEMVELRPDRGDLNPFLSGRRLVPCGKYQNNLLLFLGGRDRRALLLSNRFETLSPSQIPFFVLFFDKGEELQCSSFEGEAVRHLAKVKLLRPLGAGMI